MSKFNAVLKRVQHILYPHNEEFRVRSTKNMLYELRISVEINCGIHV